MQRDGETGRIDFSRRAEPAELPEWMDGPCSYEEFRDCLVDLGKANRLTLAQRPTLDWLERLVALHAVVEQATPLRIVDVGCGGGDMLRRIAVWARRRGLAVALTGIDLNPYAARAAHELSPGDCAIEWRTGDAFSYAPVEGIDVVISSLVMHHLAESEIVRLLAWMEAVARRGWLVNDLRRSRGSYVLFAALAKAARWHRFVQHDGPVSIRRSFRAEDWRRMCSAAGLKVEGQREAVAIMRRFPGRLCVGRLK